MLSAARRAGRALQRAWLTVKAETDAEKRIAAKIEGTVAGCELIAVKDTSGGCGTMYEIRVLSDAFRGKSKVQQQMLVMRGLQEEVSQWHGFTMMTEVPDKP